MKRIFRKIAAAAASLMMISFAFGNSSYAALEDGTYSVPVTLKKAVEDAESMGAKALEPQATVVVQNGKPKFTLYFKGLSFMNMYGHIVKLYTYPKGTDLTSQSKSPQEVQVTENFRDKGLDNQEAEFPRAFTFEREDTEETEIPVRVLVDAMSQIASDGKGEQDARIIVDYSSATESNGKAPEVSSSGSGSSEGNANESKPSSGKTGADSKNTSNSTSNSSPSSGSGTSSAPQKSSSEDSSAPENLPKTGSLINKERIAVMSAILIGLGIIIRKKVK